MFIPIMFYTELELVFYSRFDAGVHREFATVLVRGPGLVSNARGASTHRNRSLYRERDTVPFSCKININNILLNDD